MSSNKALKNDTAARTEGYCQSLSLIHAIHLTHQYTLVVEYEFVDSLQIEVVGNEIRPGYLRAKTLRCVCGEEISRV